MSKAESVNPCVASIPQLCPSVLKCAHTTNLYHHLSPNSLFALILSTVPALSLPRSTKCNKSTTVPLVRPALPRKSSPSNATTRKKANPGTATNPSSAPNAPPPRPSAKPASTAAPTGPPARSSPHAEMPESEETTMARLQCTNYIRPTSNLRGGRSG